MAYGGMPSIKMPLTKPETTNQELTQHIRKAITDCRKMLNCLQSLFFISPRFLFSKTQVTPS
jgi:hypothetical protein